jgi:outer membrane protein OmpA-like peptidoglycan-associated protein
MMRNSLRLGAIGLACALGASSHAENASRLGAASENAAAPTKDEIIKALTPPPATPQTRGVRGIRGIGRVEAAVSATPSSEMRDTPNSTYFQFNSAQLTPFGAHVVDEYIKALKDPTLNTYSFRIVGHTDSVGSDKYNDDLSQKRAQAVRAYMTAHGVDASKLDVLGKGKRELKNPGNPTGAENRRVVILNVGKK